MTKITKDNIEAYLLDHVEKNISAPDTELLLAFLEKNPQYKSLLDDYVHEFKLQLPTLSQPEKHKLMMVDFENDTINKNNFEDFSTALLESELSTFKKTELIDFLNVHPEFKNAHQTIQKLVLKQDESIVYLEKENLKKGFILYPYFYRIAGVAAVFIFFFYVWNYNPFAVEKNHSAVVLKVPSEVKNEKQTTQPKEILHEKIAINEPVKITKKIKYDRQLSTQKNIQNIVKENDEIEQKNIFENIAEAPVRTVDFISDVTSQRVLSSGIIIKKNETSNITNDENFLSFKQFALLMFEKKVLKSDEADLNLSAGDFSKVVSQSTNNKVTVDSPSENHTTWAFSTKNFSIERKIHR